MSRCFAVVSVISLFVNSLRISDWTLPVAHPVRPGIETIDASQVKQRFTTGRLWGCCCCNLRVRRDIRVLLPVDSSVAEQDQAEQAAQVGESLAAMLQQEARGQVTLLGSDYVSALKSGESCLKPGWEFENAGRAGHNHGLHCGAFRFQIFSGCGGSLGTRR